MRATHKPLVSRKNLPLRGHNACDFKTPHWPSRGRCACDNGKCNESIAIVGAWYLRRVAMPNSRMRRTPYPAIAGALNLRHDGNDLSRASPAIAGGVVPATRTGTGVQPSHGPCACDVLTITLMAETLALAIAGALYVRQLRRAIAGALCLQQTPRASATSHLPSQGHCACDIDVNSICLWQ